MTNITLIAIGVVVPLTILIGGASAFIWLTERKRKQNIVVNEVPRRPRITSRLYRARQRWSTQIEDGIEVCSPRPSFSKHEQYPASDAKSEYERPNLHASEARANSAGQSPTKTFDQVSELEGTLGIQLWKPPLPKAKLRYSSNEPYKTARKDVLSRASLQPQSHYGLRNPLQPIATTKYRNRAIHPISPVKEVHEEGLNTPTISAISELSGRGLSSPRYSNTPGEQLAFARSGGWMTDNLGELPASTKRMSFREMLEKHRSVDGAIPAPSDTPQEKSEVSNV